MRHATTFAETAAQLNLRGGNLALPTKFSGHLIQITQILPSAHHLAGGAVNGQRPPLLVRTMRAEAARRIQKPTAPEHAYSPTRGLFASRATQESQPSLNPQIYTYPTYTTYQPQPPPLADPLYHYATAPATSQRDQKHEHCLRTPLPL